MGSNQYFKRMASIGQNAPEGSTHGTSMANAVFTDVWGPVYLANGTSYLGWTNDFCWRVTRNGAGQITLDQYGNIVWTTPTFESPTGCVLGYSVYPSAVSAAWPTLPVVKPTSVTDGGHETVGIKCVGY